MQYSTLGAWGILLVSYPNYNPSYDSRSASKQRKINEIDYKEFRRRKLIRKAVIKRRKQQALRRLIFFAIVLFIFLLSFINVSYNHVYLPFKNSSLHLKPSTHFLNSTEAMLLKPDIFGNKQLLNNNSVDIKPIMKSIPLGKELTDLKKQLIPILNTDSKYKAGFFVWDSWTDDYVSINSDDAFKTASIVKIPILIELFRHIESGLINYDSMLKYNTHHIATGSGSLQYRPTEGEYSIDYLANIMIKQSDNTATNILLNEIGGMSALNSALRSWGISKGHMENWLPDLTGTNIMTPKEYATMLYNVLVNNDFLTRESRHQIIEYMSKIKHRNLINHGMPAGSTISHKTGDIGEMVGDAGIITLPNGKKIIIVAMVERPWNSYKAKDMIKEASRITYNYFSNHR